MKMCADYSFSFVSQKCFAQFLFAQSSFVKGQEKSLVTILVVYMYCMCVYALSPAQSNNNIPVGIHKPTLIRRCIRMVQVLLVLLIRRLLGHKQPLVQPTLHQHRPVGHYAMS